MPEFRQPFFSIITPTYKRPEYLKRTILSVRSQSFKDYEHIIIDDANDPDTKYTIDTWPDDRIVMIQHKARKGAAGAYNTGLLSASGRFILFLDDDDEFMPDMLEKLSLFWSGADAEIGFIWTGITVVADSDKGEKTLYSKIWPSKFKNHTEGLIEATTIGNGYGLCVRRECIDAIGLYDESFLMGHDADFLIRLAEKYKFMTIPEPLVKIHYHENSQLTDKANNLLRLEIRERILWKHREYLERFSQLYIAHYKLIAELSYGLGLKEKGRKTMKSVLKKSSYSFINLLDFLMYEITGKNCSSIYRSNKLKWFRRLLKSRSKYLRE